MNHLKKYILFLGLVIFGFSIAEAQRPFVTLWNAMHDGISDVPNQIVFPGLGQYEYTYIDYVFENNEGSGIGNGSEIITFPEPGIYRVSVTPIGSNPFYGIQLNNEGTCEKLLQIEQWGDVKWRTLSGAFYGAKRMTITATDIPDLSRVTDMSYAFARVFDMKTVPNMNQWDVSKVTDMSNMFNGAQDFNGDISDWNVSRVTTMEGMFSGATAFNADISRWNVKKVTNMASMFSTALVFNQPIGKWNVRNVTNMDYMFADAANFNQNLNNWNVKKIRSMKNIFFFADRFDKKNLKWKFHRDVDQSRLY